MKLRKKTAVMMLAAALAVSAAVPSMAAGWEVNADGKWMYLDEYGAPVCASVTPDGYLTDVFGVWEETNYDSLVGTYAPESVTIDGADNSTEDVAGITQTLKVSLNTEQHLVLKTVWAYANGSVMRSSEDEYYPNTNGTFSAYYYTERKGNDRRWRDMPTYSNYAALTDNGDGTLTLVQQEDGGTRTTVYRKQ